VKRASPKSFKTFLELAHLLADRAGEVILPQFRKKIAVTNKAKLGAYDPVTVADKRAERAISRLIAEHFPDHGITGEEHGSARPDARFRWVIDPIDGTRAFITGSPLWGTLIGLLDDGAPILGLMDQPFTRERAWSGAGASFARDGDGTARRIKTRTCRDLASAVLMTTSPEMFAKGAESERFARLQAKARMTRFGGDCYAYILLAQGFVDLVVEAGLQSYDVVALIPIIERAGGRMTTWDGAPATNGGRIVAAGDPRLHAQALEILAR
jgi:myo-inositol-1(or 4)-monophosphatase